MANKEPTERYTEGCIQEIKVQDKTISVTLTPSDEFSFGSDESIHSGCKKMVIVHGDEQVADFVGLDTTFVVANIDLNTVYAMKKDRAKLRVSVKKTTEPVYAITSLTVL